MTPIVVKPLLYGQEAGAVRLKLPSDWNGMDGPFGVEVEVDSHNTQTLLSIVLTAIRMSGDPEAIELARMTCRALLGAA